MAFVLADTWREEAGAGALAAPPLFPALAANGRDRYWARSGGILLTLGVHLLLLWLLLSRLSGSLDPAASAVERPVPMTFTLSQAGASAPQALITPVHPPPPAQQSELDATVPDALLPVEWTVARIALPEPARDSAAPPPSPQQPSAGGGGIGASGTGAGGAGVYDPFAGAAPLRRERVGDRPASGNAAPLALNRQLLDSVQRKLYRSHPGARGTVTLTVRVSPDGVVVEAIPRGGTASAGAKEALRRALIGLRLFSGTAATPQLLDLPSLTLGG